MQTHQKLTALGVVLLLATIAISYYHDTDHPGEGFNYAYVTGIAMIIVFMASFVMFNMDKWEQSKKSKT